MKHAYMRLLASGLLALVLAMVSANTLWAQGRGNSGQEISGTFTNADYTIRVPENWNGTLLVYARGYSYDLPDAAPAPGPSQLHDFLLSQGYALAGSAYRDSGWAVKEGIQNTLALTNRFNGLVGKPERTILWGFSMGSVVAFKMIETYPNHYDGMIAGCSVAGGTPLAWDAGLGFTLAYATAFGWPSEWGPVSDIRDDLDFETEVLPVVLSQLSDSSAIPLFEFVRLVSGLPSTDFYPISAQSPGWLLTNMKFVTEGRAELESRAGGPIAQNLDHEYVLSPADKVYLGALGVDADSLLAAMNGQTNISAQRNARHYLEKYADYSGDLQRPVLSLHSTSDPLVPVFHERVYADRVAQAGKADLLVQAYVDTVGHCAFTGPQLLSTLGAMSFWLDTGQRPPAAFFPAAAGFVDFTPEPPSFLPDYGVGAATIDSHSDLVYLPLMGR